jgi:polysaccharide pyruvyl transferase WcaK-like protein
MSFSRRRREENMTQRNKRGKIAFFGHFDATNFGNEATFQAIRHRLRCLKPDAEFVCISTGRPAVASEQIDYVPISGTFAKAFRSRHPLVRLMHEVFVGAPVELWRWIKGFALLRRADALIVPGTGLLTDAGGLRSFGPYNMFKWSVIAKTCRCKLLFVSVGAGPLYSPLGRWFVKSALSCADFRSYRDESTREYLSHIGLDANGDVYPDLAFSISEASIPVQGAAAGGRPVVGLGLMTDSGRYGTATPSPEVHRDYLENLAKLVKWLIVHEYDVRLFIGDFLDDRNVTREFRGLLEKRLSAEQASHIIDEPVLSVEDLLSQIAKTDLVVATRFHNVIFALLCNKPVISISFHHKCESLMSAMGLTAYCLNINELTADVLIDKLRDLTVNAKALKASISEKSGEFRRQLDEQYTVIAGYI